MWKKRQGESVNNWQLCVLCGETFDNEDEHLTIYSQRGKVNMKKTQKNHVNIVERYFTI